MSMPTSKLESAYKYMFTDQCESANDEYLERFKAEFNPDNVDWNNDIEAFDVFIALANELYESRSDMAELFSAAGISPGDLDELGLL